MSRSLEAEHQPRTLRAKGLGVAVKEPQRISHADEAVLCKRGRRNDMARELALLEEGLRAQLRNLRDPDIRPTRQTYRDLGNAIALIGKVRGKLADAAS